MRLVYDSVVLSGSAISIHAPREGCDGTDLTGADLTGRFQSTHPVRGATKDQIITVVEAKFQSTHPVRGATHGSGIAQPIGPISIHAPREGCDALAMASDTDVSISIHAPREGCDKWPEPARWL